MSDVQAAVESAIASNLVVVYSKSYCPYSKRAKSLLASIPRKREEPKVFELDEMGEEGVETQMYLLERTGQRTVPNVFIGQKHIGGSSDLDALHEAGSLEPLITLPSYSPALFLFAVVLLALGAAGFGVRYAKKRSQQPAAKEKL